MHVGMTMVSDQEVVHKTDVIIDLIEPIDSYFITRNYGQDLQQIAIGFICVMSHKGYEGWYKVRRPRYTEIGYISLSDASLKEVKGSFSWEIKLDFDTILHNTYAENEKLLAFEVMKSLCYLDNLSKKVKDFDKERFASDMKEFFRGRSLISDQGYAENMNFGMSVEYDYPVRDKVKVVRELSDLLNAYFQGREYGEDLQQIWVVCICVKPIGDYERKIYKPRYSSIGCAKLPDGMLKELKGCFCYDMKLDFDLVLRNTDEENKRLLALVLLNSLSHLDNLSKRLKKGFDKERFKLDMKAFFEEQSLI